MRVSPKKAAKLVWADINAAGTIAWLLTVGVPAVIASSAAIVARALGASWPLLIPLGVGVFLILLALMLALIGKRRASVPSLLGVPAGGLDDRLEQNRLTLARHLDAILGEMKKRGFGDTPPGTEEPGEPSGNLLGPAAQERIAKSARRAQESLQESVNARVYEAVIKVNTADEPARRARDIAEGIGYACALLMDEYGWNAESVAEVPERTADDVHDQEAQRRDGS